jgi:hypothetical protein
MSATSRAVERRSSLREARASRPPWENLENYFNYFTEIEECFRKCRGAPTLLSPLDWALIESWKEARIPLEAVLNGIERAFEKYARRPRPFQKINGLAYCTQTVMQAAEELNTALVEGGPSRPPSQPDAAPFSAQEIADYLNRNAEILEEARAYWQEKGQGKVADDLPEVVAGLRKLAGEAPERAADLRELENYLSALEEKLTASVTRAAPVELLAQIRREAERELVRCRREMTAGQIESLERQFQKRRLYEHYGIPRLSLFYL